MRCGGGQEAWLARRSRCLSYSTSKPAATVGCSRQWCQMSLQAQDAGRTPSGRPWSSEAEMGERSPIGMPPSPCAGLSVSVPLLLLLTAVLLVSRFAATSALSRPYRAGRLGQGTSAASLPNSSGKYARTVVVRTLPRDPPNPAISALRRSCRAATPLTAFAPWSVQFRKQMNSTDHRALCGGISGSGGSGLVTIVCCCISQLGSALVL